jgi:hypothetical protein
METFSALKHETTGLFRKIILIAYSLPKKGYLIDYVIIYLSIDK